MTEEKYQDQRSKLIDEIDGLKDEANSILTDETREYDSEAQSQVAAKLEAVEQRKAKLEALDKIGFSRDAKEVDEERAWDRSPAIIRSRGRKGSNDIHSHAAVEGYSVSRAVDNFLDKGRLSGVEAEVDQELGRTQKRSGNFLMPYGNVQKLNERTLNTTTGSGAVPTLWDASQFVDYLYPLMVGPKLGWNYMDGVMAGTKLPRQSGVPTVSAVAESGSASSSQPGIDNVTFMPHTLTANVSYSRRFGYTSVVGADAYINKAGARQIALSLENGALNGTGSSNQVTGLFNTAGTGQEILAANTLAYSNIISMKKKLALANANNGNKLAWLTGPSGFAKGQTTAKIGSTYPVFIVSEDGQINGEPVAVTSQVPENLSYCGTGSLTAFCYGNWDFFNVAMFGNGLDVIIDPYTNSTSGDVTITFLMDYDVQLTQPSAFIIAANSTI